MLIKEILIVTSRCCEAGCIELARVSRARRSCRESSVSSQGPLRARWSRRNRSEAKDDPPKVSLCVSVDHRSRQSVDQLVDWSRDSSSRLNLLTEHEDKPDRDTRTIMGRWKIVLDNTLGMIYHEQREFPDPAEIPRWKQVGSDRSDRVHVPRKLSKLSRKLLKGLTRYTSN